MRYCSRCLQGLSDDDPAACPGSRCGAARPGGGWPETLKEGERVDGRFVVEGILGWGGAGVTYLAQDLQEGDAVALKVLHADRRRGPLVRRFLIEAEALQLFEHPHIVRFRALNLGREPHFYLSTAYLAGGSLETYIRDQGGLPLHAVRDVGRQVALALHAVHDAGIIHRDLKPGNVFIEDFDGPTPIIKLGDFGIARMWRPFAPSPSITRTGAFVGTPEYAAPEQLRGEKAISSAADAWALGALLHFLAAGRHLVGRAEVRNWEEFKRGVVGAKDRLRLAVLLDEDADAGAAAELDTIIDRLRDERPSVRPDMAEVARLLGASAGQLRPQPIASSPTPTLLSIGEDDGWRLDVANAMFSAEEVGEGKAVEAEATPEAADGDASGDAPTSAVDRETLEAEVASSGGPTDPGGLPNLSATGPSDLPPDRHATRTPGSSFRGVAGGVRPVVEALRTEIEEDQGGSASFRPGAEGARPVVEALRTEVGDEEGEAPVFQIDAGGARPLAAALRTAVGDEGTEQGTLVVGAESTGPDAAAVRAGGGPVRVALDPSAERPSSTTPSDEDFGTDEQRWTRPSGNRRGLWMAVAAAAAVLAAAALLLRSEPPAGPGPAAGDVAAPQAPGSYRRVAFEPGPTPSAAPTPAPVEATPVTRPANEEGRKTSRPKTEPRKSRSRPEPAAPAGSKKKPRPAEKESSRKEGRSNGGSGSRPASTPGEARIIPVRDTSAPANASPGGPVDSWATNPEDRRPLAEVLGRAGVPGAQAHWAQVAAAIDEAGVNPGGEGETELERQARLLAGAVATEAVSKPGPGPKQASTTDPLRAP